MACFVSAGESGLVLGRVEGMRLVLASQGHLEIDGRNRWIAHNGTTNMFTGDSKNFFILKPTPVGRECMQNDNVDFRWVL